MKTVLGLFFGLLLGAALTWFALRPHAAGGAAAASAEGAKPAEKEKENPLHFPSAKREAAGIALAAVGETTLTPEISAFGRVLDPTPLIQLVAELATARAAASASEKEKTRAEKLLSAGGNASAQVVETAQANAARDQLAVSSAQARLAVTWGRSVVQDLAAIEQALGEGASLARLDVLTGETVAAQPKTARINLVGTNEKLDAEVLGVSPVGDAQIGGTGFLVLVRGHALPVGAALRGTLPGVGDAAKVLVVPRSAVVYHQGSAWVFILGEEDIFERKLVSLGSSVDDEHVVVLQGLTAGEQIVVTGPQQMLAAELQAGGAVEED